jgi:apolipoprotein N-acyltransferase
MLNESYPAEPSSPPPKQLAQLAQFCRLFGLHPLVALALFTGDWMLNALEIASLGLFAVVSAFVALLLFPAVAVVQKQSYGEPTWAVSLAKAAIVSILLGIPTALPSVITAAMGFAGAYSMRHRDDDANTIDTTGTEV